MFVTLFGYTGRATSTADVPRKDGTGYFQISDTALWLRIKPKPPLRLHLSHAKSLLLASN
jgi:hypothetical protein